MFARCPQTFTFIRRLMATSSTVKRPFEVMTKIKVSNAHACPNERNGLLRRCVYQLTRLSHDAHKKARQCPAFYNKVFLWLGARFEPDYRFDALVPLKHSVTITVKCAVPQSMLTNARALHEEANFVLVCHPDTTVHLDPFATDQIVGIV